MVYVRVSLATPQPRQRKEAERLLQALAEFHGKDWTEALSRQWREALESSVQLMFEGYDQSFHV